MTGSDANTTTASVINLSERGWPRIGPNFPQPDNQIPVSLAGNDNQPYNIDIKAGYGIEVFTVYYYIWDGSNAGQNDTLYTQPTGAFQMGAGDDTVTSDADGVGEFPNPYFLLGEGNDHFDGSPGHLGSSTYGGGGDDVIIGGQNDDSLWGDEADSFLVDFSYQPPYPSPYQFQLEPYDTANDGDDTISGGAGNDTIVGGNGNNKLDGGDGADTLTAGSGSDYLYGGPRGDGFLDILTGGGGSDTFILSYGSDATGSSGDFWSGFFDAQTSAIGGNVVSNLLASAFAKGVGDIAGAIAGPIGGAVLSDFVDFLFGLDSTPPPKPQTTDVMMVTDFDPSMDVLILPLITNDQDGKDLTIEADFFAEFADGSTNAWGLKFSEDSTEFAEIRLADDYVAALGYAPTDSEAPLQDILDALKVSAALIEPDGTFSTLASAEVLALLPSGGFTPPANAGIPSGATVDVFGAIGGELTATGGVYTTIAGTQYSDALTVNAAIVDPATIRVSDLASQNSTVFGLGGGDVLYGGGASDTLVGGDGDDTLYSFLDALGSGESLSGGDGDDMLHGGASGGVFDGGAGTDTFGVVYGNLLKNALDQGPDGMQLVVDLTQGYAAERPASDDPDPGTAPVGATPPFDDSVPNAYKLVDIENVIGGPLNDWIRAAQGSVIEGGAGPDYLDFGAGNVVLSYASSNAGVNVNTSVQSPYAQGGDAAGDYYANLGSTTQSSLSALIGSANADSLYVLASVVNEAEALWINVTGLGGADVFGAFSNANPDNSEVTITDFSLADGDRIDLRPQGVTSFSEGVTIAYAADTVIDINEASSSGLQIVLQGFDSTLSAGDFIFSQAVSGTAIGNHTDEGFAGGPGDDVIEGRGGNDILYGNGGDDTLKGQAGQDWLYGGDGHDRLFGGAGNDAIDGGSGDDLVRGGAGDDHIAGGAGDDTIRGDAGADTIDAGEGDDFVLGGLGDDILVGGLGDDVILGGAGVDTAVFTGAFSDHLVTGFGSLARTVEDLAGGGSRDRLADVELLQFDDGILDLRSGAFDAGGVSSPAVEAPVAGPGFAADLEPLLTPVV
jgi:Ca2+-binding RTX toxin-like protein